jgi:hypothetical protein
MIPEPYCSKRECKHYLGVKWLGEEEWTEVVVCKAFPKGIPDEIAYGDNLHTEPFKGDNGIQFDKG